MAETEPLLSLFDVGKSYPSPEGLASISIFSGVTLDLMPGESLSVVGPSGSGKSTLLNIVGTLDRPTSGNVRLEGEDLGSMHEARLAAVRNRKLGFVFQSHFLLPHCTVMENVLLPTLAHGTHETSEAVRRAEQLLKRVGLANRLAHRPGQLSGGECQRVAVVRALINRPVLLLADEPTGSLDHANATQVVDLLLHLNQEENAALILVTHARDLASRTRRVFELRDGRLVKTAST